MDARALSQRLAEIAADLGAYHGHRTVWIDLAGRIVHSEPEEELEAEGYLYVGTFLRPGVDELVEAAARFVALSPAPAARPAEPAPDLADVGLVPA